MFMKYHTYQYDISYYISDFKGCQRFTFMFAVSLLEIILPEYEVKRGTETRG